ncbi:MAG: hypothetical protein Q9196_003219 [Gyalolechia fulgens]
MAKTNSVSPRRSIIKGSPQLSKTVSSLHLKAPSSSSRTAPSPNNPVDWKVRDHGAIVTKYPNILGTDISGTVEAVSPEVFKKGDRVTGYAAHITNGDINHGAFQ